MLGFRSRALVAAAVAAFAVGACGGGGGSDGPIDASANADGCASPSTYYRDVDSDDWGDTNASIEACDVPEGYVVPAGDCDDTDDTVHPQASEACNGVDDDCAPSTVDGLDACGAWSACVSDQCVIPTWNRAVGSGITDVFFSVRATPFSGSYYLAGYTDGFGAGAEDAYAVRVGVTGEVEFSATLGGSGFDYASSAVTSVDGSRLFLCGETRSGNPSGRMLVAAVDLPSAVLWAKEIDDGEGTSVAHDCDVATNGDLLVAGQTYKNSTYHGPIVRVRDGGVITWTRSYNGLFPRAIRGDGANGGFVGGEYLQRAAVAAFDAGGALQWLLRIDTGRIGYVYSIELFSNGDVLAIYDDSIVQAALRISSDGAVVWAKTFSGLTGIHSAATAGDVAVVAGDSDSGPVLVQLDATGAIIGARALGGVGSYARDATTDGNGAVLLVTQAAGTSTVTKVDAALDGLACIGDVNATISATDFTSYSNVSGPFNALASGTAYDTTATWSSGGSSTDLCP